MDNYIYPIGRLIGIFGSPVEANSSITFEPSSVAAGEYYTFTVTLRDSGNKPTPAFALAVVSDPTTGVVISPEEGITDSAGEFTFTVSASEAGTVDVGVLVNEGRLEFTLSAQVEFTSGGSSE